MTKLSSASLASQAKRNQSLGGFPTYNLSKNTSAFGRHFFISSCFSGSAQFKLIVYLSL